MKNLKILKAAEEYLKGQPEVVFERYPVYDDRVMAVLGTLNSDTDYMIHHEKLENKAIETYDLNELATMYTFLLRGERFCDGHIAAYIEDGTLLKLVERHIELLEKKKKARRILCFDRKKK